MKTKTKRKDIRDLQYPCYFTAITEFKEGSNPVDAVEAQNQAMARNNSFFKTIQDENQKFIRDLMSRTDSEVADEDFFRFIGYDPAILGSHFALEKISRWQDEMQSDDRKRSGGVAAFKAESNLNRIGSTLALKGKHSPSKILLAAFFKDFLREQLKKPERNEFLQVLEDHIGIVIRDDDEIAGLFQDIDFDRKNLPRLINLMIAKMMKTTEGMVRKYLKQVTDIYENGQKIGYAIEVKSKS
jgi:hypothetical protein